MLRGPLAFPSKWAPQAPGDKPNPSDERPPEARGMSSDATHPTRSVLLTPEPVEEYPIDWFLLPVAQERTVGFIPFPNGISAMWNAISIVRDLNSCRRVNFQRCYHYITGTSASSYYIYIYIYILTQSHTHTHTYNHTHSHKIWCLNYRHFK